MQLSLPVLNNPAPVLPAVPSAFAAGDEAAGVGAWEILAPAGAAASFVECFPMDHPAPTGALNQGEPAMENAAVLAAAFWLQAMPPAQPGPELVSIDAGTVLGATVPADITPSGRNPARYPPLFPALPPAQARSEAGRVEMPPASTTALRDGKNPEQVFVAPAPGSAIKADNPDPAEEPPAESPVPANITRSPEVVPAQFRLPGAALGWQMEMIKARKPAVAPVEKIAVARAAPGNPRAMATFRDEKEILNAGLKPVAEPGAPLGTAVADSAPPMPTAPSHRSKAFPAAPIEVPAPTGGSFTVSLPADVAGPVATVREAMAAVLHAVNALEQRADNQPPRVDLHLQVGGEPMSLRVELKEGTVHTIFQTVSDDLRSALSREWEAVVPPAIAAHLRLADPVFTAPAGVREGDAFGSAGQGALPQRGQPGPESPPVARFIPSTGDQPPGPQTIATTASAGLSLLHAFA